MLSAGDRVLVALSGGADSMCLLNSLWENSEKLGITVCAAHYNHRLRGEESERDARFAEKQCAQRNIPFLCESGDVSTEAEKTHRSLEETAREMRYAFLREAAEKLSCNVIATAHNADDNAETVLLNLTRGSGAKGLSGIPLRRGNIVRPLLMNTREEIEAYLEERNIPHVEDSSNASDDYTRNLIRHRVIPVLKEINPAFSDAVLRACLGLREDEALLSSMAEKFISENMSGNSIAIDALKALPKPVAVRVFRTVCRGSLAARHCDALLKLLEGEGLGYADVPGMRVSRDSGRLYFGAENEKLGSYELSVNGEVFISERNETVKTRLIEGCTEVFKSINKFDFNYNSIYGKISLTSRCDGDRIRLSYRDCTKSLKELFSEKKLPQNVRNITPVFRDGEGVIAVYGFGVAERCEAKCGDTVLRVEIIKNDCTGDNYGKNQ